MIARFILLLPYSLHVRSSDSLPAIRGTIDGYEYLLYPPRQAPLSVSQISRATPLMRVIDALVPKQSVVDPLVTIDGSPTVESNLLQIDFLRDGFDRAKWTDPTVDGDTHGDPPPTVAFTLINGFLRKVRSINRSSFVRELSPKDVFWRMQYLDDDQSELAENSELFRMRFSGYFNEHLAAIESAMWNTIANLTAEYQPPIWDKLLLDAEDALPEVGATVVLAATALETIAKAVVDHLAKSAVSPALWDWINDRDHFLKEPSVEERLDTMITILGGDSLKTQPRLWEAFKNLKQARNSCVHEGRPAIGGKVVTAQVASQLIDKAVEAVRWLERYLPPERQSVPPATSLHWNIQRPVA